MLVCIAGLNQLWRKFLRYQYWAAHRSQQFVQCFRKDMLELYLQALVVQ